MSSHSPTVRLFASLLTTAGDVVGTRSFGRIISTRFATGESRSSRQVEFAMKLVF
jgi:hypothetical protein